MFKEDSSKPSLPADVLWGFFVTHSWRNECLTNEPQRTSAGRLQQAIQKLCFNKDNNDNDHNDDYNNSNNNINNNNKWKGNDKEVI